MTREFCYAIKCNEYEIDTLKKRLAQYGIPRATLILKALDALDRELEREQANIYNELQRMHTLKERARLS